MRSRSLLLAIIFFCASFGANASFVDTRNFQQVDGSNFWTNFDLGLDVLRLDWADTLGSPSSEQQSRSDFINFVGSNQNGWRFATLTEFDAYVDWFDSDPNSNDWSEAQNAGSNLFFQLNGLGPGFTEQDGYDSEGYTYWQLGTLNPFAGLFDNPFTYSWIADFADSPLVTCAGFSVLCNSGYFPDENAPEFTAFDAFSLSYANGNPLNVAPLLVRDIGLSSISDSVNAPTGLGIFFASCFVWLCFKRKSRYS
jgi:hypothetical protein